MSSSPVVSTGCGVRTHLDLLPYYDPHVICVLGYARILSFYYATTTGVEPVLQP